MLRQISAFIEAATAKRCLILVLEDLHWSDISTLALLSSLARRHEVARVMIVGTYRPAETFRRKHALRGLIQDLAHCEYYRELPLVGLDEDAVFAYVTQRFPGHTLPATIGKTIYRRTEGNPLFIVNMVAHLVAQGLIAPRNGRWAWQGQETQLLWSIPDTLRHVIEGQMDRLSQEEQRLLEVGSVAGMEFSAAVIAAVLSEDLISIEECCETLARHRLFLHVAGTRAEQERRLVTRYRFLHSLYLALIYERLPQAKRRQLHKVIAVYKEQEYGERAVEIAPELATHFKEGREYHRAVHYLGLAAQTAMQRHAPHEALNHLHQAQALLATLPESPELEKQLREVQRALQHPLLSLANTEARNIRYPGLSQSQFRKIA
jgi:predicted ATPase